MRVVNIGSNMTEVDTGSALILVSYSTPVAASISGSFIRTAKKHSNTTTRHINKWLAGCAAEVVPQKTLDALLWNANGLA